MAVATPGEAPWSAASVGTMLSTAQVQHFTTYGWLLTRVLDEQAATALVRWVDEVATWPDEARA